MTHPQAGVCLCMFVEVVVVNTVLAVELLLRRRERHKGGSCNFAVGFVRPPFLGALRTRVLKLESRVSSGDPQNCIAVNRCCKAADCGGCNHRKKSVCSCGQLQTSKTGHGRGGGTRSVSIRDPPPPALRAQ